jgi:lipoate-protein ligase A
MLPAWRFIDTGSSDAAYNMAIDESIAHYVRRHHMPPTLRLYGWTQPSVSLGSFQKTTDIDLPYCLSERIPVVRRPTGGRAILHDVELTYSFTTLTSSGLFSRGLLDSYRKLGMAFIRAFVICGIAPINTLVMNKKRSSNLRSQPHNPLCFASASYGEMTIHGKKIIGSAQKRWTDVLLQQGCIPFKLDKKRMTRILGVRVQKILENTFVGLAELIPDLKIETLKSAIAIAFEETFEVKLKPSSLSDDEIALAGKLTAEKYHTPQWTCRR